MSQIKKTRGPSSPRVSLVGTLKSLQQFRQRFAVIEEVAWPARAVGKGLRRIDTHGAIKGCQDLGCRAAAVARLLATGRRRTDGLAHAHAAAGHERRHHRGPVVAARATADT